MTRSRMSARVLCALVAGVLPAACATVPEEEAPLRVLIVSGGGYHDYARQRTILEEGLEWRLNVEVAHVFSPPGPLREGRPAIPAFRDPAYARGYDLVIHNECAAEESDPAVLDAVLAPHREGMPAVNLHCAMHSFRSGAWGEPVAPGADNARWFAFTGIQSTGHGPQAPIRLSPADHPIAQGIAQASQAWVTPDEELYNNLTRFDVTPVLMGEQPASVEARWRGPVVVAWTHLYGPQRARVFSTTLAHNEATMEDARYLDLVARGVAWASGHLSEDGSLDPAIRPGR